MDSDGFNVLNVKIQELLFLKSSTEELKNYLNSRVNK
jgi:hypothetical protein